VKLLFDHNLSHALPRSLTPLFPEHEFVALADKFAQDTSDVDWITALSDEGGWSVLTKDLRIQFRPHERLALDRAKIVFYFLDGAWRKYPVAETAARLIRLIPVMALQSSIAERGRIDLPVNAGSKLRPHRN
jgi:hypothetical protein